MSSSPRGNITSLDGFRGLAIGLVLLYHGWTFDRYGTGVGHVIDQVRSIGWAGVDVFFVLSGFLITGILLETKDKPNYWRNFLIRRGLRIFPLYYAVLIAIMIGTLVMPELSRSGVAAIWVNFLYITNFWIARYGENQLPLDSAWSLAIEEQFYLVYPAVVRRTSRATLAKILVGVMIAAPLLRWFTYEHGAQPQLGPYVLPYCRLDSLAFGALLRLAMDPSRIDCVDPRLVLYARLAPILCAASIAVLMTWPRGQVISDVRYVVGGYTLTAIAAGSLLVRILLAQPSAWLRRAFEWRPLVHLGKISYGVYLMHLIARVVAAKMLSGVFAPADRGGTAFCAAQLTLMVALTVAVATASFYWFERPLLRLKDRWAPN